MNSYKQKPLCPFKKVAEKYHSSFTGKTTTKERFDVCAGERCMAYHGGRCLRVESEKQKK